MARGRQGQELTMRKIREILRLGLQCGLSNREISRSCNVSRSTVGKYIDSAQKASMSYLDTTKMDNRQLKEVFKQERARATSKPQPDWAYIHQEKKKKGINKTLIYLIRTENTSAGMTKLILLFTKKNIANNTKKIMTMSLWPLLTTSKRIKGFQA